MLNIEGLLGVVQQENAVKKLHYLFLFYNMKCLAFEYVLHISRENSHFLFGDQFLRTIAVLIKNV